jgi:type IX secretion system PorP/SprF family membrane protein
MMKICCSFKYLIFKKIKFCLLFVLLLFSYKTYSQFIGLNSSYLYDPVLINPSFSGYKDIFTTMLYSRNQWLGIQNGPVTKTFSANLGIESKKSRIKSSKLGLSLELTDEKNLPFDRNLFRFTYAYHVPTHYGYLGFGLSGILQQLKIDQRDFSPLEPSDPLINKTIERALIPDANFGMNFYNKYYSVGIAVSNMMGFENKLEGPQIAEVPRSLTLYSATFLKPVSSIYLEPSFLMSLTGKRAIFDINSKILFDDLFQIAFSYRIGEQLSLQSGLKYKNFQIIYAYDIYQAKIIISNYGTHSLILLFRLPSKK